MTNIITKNIGALLFIELRDYMERMVYESIKALGTNQTEELLWYEDCTMEEYFHEWQEIWDEDTKVGEGIDTIAHQFVLNDDTRSDFERAFEQARDSAYKECLEDLEDEKN